MTERTIEHRDHLGRIKATHALTKSPEYSCWQAMKKRCLNPKHKSFGRYGGRGIGICTWWMDFMNWHSDMGQRPSPEHSIDRKDNDGGYWCGHCDDCIAQGHPANCYWGTKLEQARNRSDTVFLTFQGRTLPRTAWAAEKGIGIGTLKSRLELGWSIEDALTIPEGTFRSRDRMLTLNGRQQSVTEWGIELGISRKTINWRISNGWSDERALTTPVGV